MPRNIDRPTPDDDRAIQAGIADNLDTIELTPELVARMRPALEVMPDLLDSSAPKQFVSVPLDREIVDRLRATGPGWEDRLGDLIELSLLPSTRAGS